MPRADKEERRAYNRAWIGHDREVHPEQYRAYAKRAQGKMRQFVDEQKQFPCTDCGGSYPSYVMDFDHRPNTEKCFNIAQIGSVSLSRLRAEIAKCDLVCANCHRMRTGERGYKYYGKK